MSFSGDVKAELSHQMNNHRHCHIAEVAAIIRLSGRIRFDENDNVRLSIQTDNRHVIRKYFTLIRKTFNIVAELAVRTTWNQHTDDPEEKARRHRVYTAAILDHEMAKRILTETQLMNEDGDFEEDLLVMEETLLKKDCCKRAFLRGAFLAAGSMSDPNGGYHLELVSDSEARTEQIIELMNHFNLNPHVVERKGKQVIYLKEGAQIVDFLNVCEAYKALMELENVRIVKEMRNTINRRVNCETANIGKTVAAGMKQMEDIRLIDEEIGLSNLPENLREIAQVRINNPDTPLGQLGDLLSVPLGKSGVNHRLRKLSAMAEQIRRENDNRVNF